MTDNLAAALAAFQAEAPSVRKGKTAKVPTKSGGSYSYSYADLADVADAAYPVLSKHGLSFTCGPRLVEGKLMLRGTLLHTSGERRHGYLPLNGTTPQEIGSALTYARRYLLGCLTGIVTDDDDDGQGAQQAAKRRPRPEVDNVPLTEKTRAELFALMADRHVTEPEAQRNAMSAVLGRTVESRSSLTEAEGQQLVASLKGDR